jgi:hypothetical protein
MKKPFYTLLLIFNLLIAGKMFAKGNVGEDTLATITAKDELVLLKADEFYEQKNYVAAMNLFDTLSILYPQSVLFKFKAGICFLHASSKHETALLYLQDVKRRKPDLEAIDYYLGRAFLYNYFYDNAIASFKEYEAKPLLKGETKIDVAHFIDYCLNGKELIKEPLNIYIENIGKPINTDNSEYVPVISSDESYMIYTYRGERSIGAKQNAKNRSDTEGDYYEDIFISYRIGEHWLYPEPLASINGKNHDAAIALSVDGQKLFVFKANKKDNGDIYMSQLKGSDWLNPVRLNRNVNTRFWEGSITMSSNEKTIFFTSNRPGGYGGRDIYRSNKQADGEWGPAKNLGPLINTKYNEDAPFIHPNNTLFYFSSEGHTSIGGYDIFKSDILGDSITPPLNLGFPVNTSSDDKYISITANGSRAYYSSGVDEGLGQQDIYTITPGVPGKKPQLAIVKGVVTANEKPIQAKIQLTTRAGETDFGTFYSNSETGKYLLMLQPFKNYKISFSAEGFKTHNEYVNTAALRKTVEVNENIHLYSSDYSLPKVESKDTVGFIFSRLEEELSKLDSMDANDDRLIAMAREREDERAANLPKNSAYFRVATEHTIKRILAQNALDQNEKPSSMNLLASNSTSTERAVTKDSAAAITEKVTAEVNSLNPTAALALETNAKPSNTIQEKSNTAVAVAGKENSNSIFGVYYKVQIGAYRFPDNFKYEKIKPLGSIEKLKLEDGITRFTLGNYETLAEAKKMRLEVIKRGIKDAWITATVNGERKLLVELSKMNLTVIN